MANVTDKNQGDSTKISIGDLKARMSTVVDHFERIRPRLIITMDKRIAPLLLNEFKNRDARVRVGPKTVIVPAKNQTYEFYKPKWWELETRIGNVRMAESPQHPSKRNFYDSAAVDRYLADMISACVN
jgi:hypothetical protein